MKTWGKTKLFMGLAGIASLAVFANVTIERSLYSDTFMVEANQNVTSRRLDDSFARVLASESKADKIAVKYLELSPENIAKINGSWEIMRGFEDIDDQVEEFYNKYSSQASSVVKVEMELAVGGVWVRGEDFERFFYISDLTESGTISIVRKLGDKHFEVLEARRLVNIKKDAPLARRAAPSAEVEQVREYKKGVELQKNLEMVAERALVPDLSKDPMTGDAVSGSLSLVDGNIEALNVVVRTQDGQEKSIDLGFMEIKDGGQFQDSDSYGEAIHGIITNNGNDAFRIRFATGPLQGAMINFMTYEQLDIVREQEEEARWKAEEAAALKEEIQEPSFDQIEPAANEQVQDEYKDEYQAEQSEEQYQEEVVTLIERSGFNFAPASDRTPASTDGE